MSLSSSLQTHSYDQLTKLCPEVESYKMYYSQVRIALYSCMSVSTLFILAHASSLPSNYSILFPNRKALSKAGLYADAMQTSLQVDMPKASQKLLKLQGMPGVT